MKVNYYKKESECYRITLIEDNEEVGHAYLYLIKNDLHDTPYGLMEDVFIEEKFRGQGRGKIVVEALIEKAKELGCYKLVGTSRLSREKVHKFYLDLGFSEHGKEFRLDFKE